MLCSYLEEAQDRIEYLESILLNIKDVAMCGGSDCFEDCDNCMQGKIHQLIKEALDEKG